MVTSRRVSPSSRQVVGCFLSGYESNCFGYFFRFRVLKARAYLTRVHSTRAPPPKHLHKQEAVEPLTTTMITNLR